MDLGPIPLPPPPLPKLPVPSSQTQKLRETRRKCRNCGAPLKGLKCHYCGTEYENC